MGVEILAGFAALLNPETFLYLVGGFVMGLVFGAIPGLTATLAVALLLPFTFAMELTNALVMVMAIFMSGMYSGSITGIIVNIPGAPSGAITTVEGYAMMKRGEGARALGLSAFASSVGGLVGALVLMFVAIPMSRFALMFQTPDKFALVVLAVVSVVVVASGSIWRSIVSVTLGLMISTVGFDNMTAQGRFVFGRADLIEGVQLLPAVIGLFAVCELLAQGGLTEKGMPKAPYVRMRRREFVPSWRDIREVGFLTYVKSSVIGVLIGMLPGGGASMASFVAYAEARRVSKKPEEYGNGSREGLSASEAANNAMCGGAVVPLLTLGIPGDSVTAIMFGVLLIHGLVPGPALLTTNFELVAPMFAALFVAAAFVFVSILIFGPWYIRLARLNRGVLYGFIAMVSMVGTFASTFSTFQMWVALAIGAFAFLLRRMAYPLVPMLMGIILGPYLEEYMRRALITSGLDPMTFISSPIAIGLYLLTFIFVWFLLIRPKRKA